MFDKLFRYKLSEIVPEGHRISLLLLLLLLECIAVVLCYCHCSYHRSECHMLYTCCVCVRCVYITSRCALVEWIRPNWLCGLSITHRGINRQNIHAQNCGFYTRWRRDAPKTANFRKSRETIIVTRHLVSGVKFGCMLVLWTRWIWLSEGCQFCEWSNFITTGPRRRR